MISATRRCNTCGKTKPIWDYHWERQGRGRGGRGVMCKPCRSVQKKKNKAKREEEARLNLPLDWDERDPHEGLEGA